MVKHFTLRVGKMGIPNRLSQVIISVLISGSTICSPVKGKVSQFNVESKHPFELRGAFPSSSSPEIIFNSGNRTLLISASNINPVGFDFSKIHTAQPRSKNYHYNEKTVIPLAWVNLPLFDTPVFNPNHVTSPIARKVQNSSTFLTPLPDDKESHSTSEIRRSNAKVIKSDWDGRSESEIRYVSENNRADKINVQTSPPPFQFERRIQLSNRGNNKQESDSTVNPTTSIQRKHIFPQRQSLRETSESGSGIKLGNEDHSVAESKVQESRGSRGNNFNPQSPVASTIGKPDQNVKPAKSNVLKASPQSRSTASSVQTHYADSNSNYSYGYTVSNKETMDVKTHSESREGQVVIGEYLVLEPDGYTRIVKYTADSSGFKASVRRVKI